MRATAADLRQSLTPTERSVLTLHGQHGAKRAAELLGRGWDAERVEDEVAGVRAKLERTLAARARPEPERPRTLRVMDRTPESVVRGPLTDLPGDGRFRVVCHRCGRPFRARSGAARYCSREDCEPQVRTSPRPAPAPAPASPTPATEPDDREAYLAILWRRVGEAECPEHIFDRLERLILASDG